MRRRELLLALTLGACRGQRPRLNVYNWSAYVAPDTIPKFEAESGIGVRYGVYESNEEMLAKVMTGNSGWDVVFASHYFIEPMRENRLLQPIQHGLLSNTHHLEPRFQRPPWDASLEWCVPYMWGGTGITYQKSLQPPPLAWADLWRENLRGRITMLDDPGEVFGACLKKLGYSVNSTNERELRLARQEAVAQKKLLRAYLNAEVRDQLVSGDVAAAQMWATTAQQALDVAPQLRFSYPREGFSIYADCMVVLRESRRAAAAHRLIDYLLRPKVSSEIVIASRTGTANASARALLPRELLENEVLYPSEKTLERAEWFVPLPAETQILRDRLWTEIKSS